MASFTQFLAATGATNYWISYFVTFCCRVSRISAPWMTRNRAYTPNSAHFVEGSSFGRMGDGVSSNC